MTARSDEQCNVELACLQFEPTTEAIAGSSNTLAEAASMSEVHLIDANCVDVNSSMKSDPSHPNMSTEYKPVKSTHEVIPQTCHEGRETVLKGDTIDQQTSNLEYALDTNELSNSQEPLLLEEETDRVVEECSKNVDKLTMHNGSETLSEELTETQFSLTMNTNYPATEHNINGMSRDSVEVLSSSSSSSSSIDNIYSNPEYRTVVQELMNSKSKIDILNTELTKLKQENEQVKVELRSAQETYKVQLETLDKKLSHQQSDMVKINELNQQQAEIASRNYNQMKSDLEAQLEKMTKRYESASKDREVSVMRYAINEKELIDLKKERETSEKRLKEISKEKDVLISKLKSLAVEKERVGQMLDNKCHDLIKVQKENEKLKEELNTREIKIKWTQNKLHTEMEAHKESQAKVDKLAKKVQESKEESDQVRRDCQAMMKAFQTSEENRAFSLDHQLKEHQASLILERHERLDREVALRTAGLEADSLKERHRATIAENNALSIKVQHLEKERLEYERNLSELKGLTDRQNQDIVDLRSRAAEMESVRIQLQHEQERVSAGQAEVERLRLMNTELQHDMAARREREAELLDFTQKLTDKNVRLQSEFSATEAKALQLEGELAPQARRSAELEARCGQLSQQAARERAQRQEESRLLARHLAEQTGRADDLAAQLEDERGENQVLRRKHASALKELTREVGQLRRRLEGATAPAAPPPASRASSSSSLNSVAVEGPPEVPATAHETTPNGTSPASGRPSLGNPNPMFAAEHVLGRVTRHDACVSGCVSGGPEPDRQLLIERIVRLQRSNARKSEKLEFLEEHSRQLVGELQRKSRLVQSYVLREQAGALSSDSMDRNKAEVSRHGGIMASVYGSRAADDAMTLELSLEINRKLQAVLEDTLLKNITLKESIDTLGAEISRLQQQRSAEGTT